MPRIVFLCPRKLYQALDDSTSAKCINALYRLLFGLVLQPGVTDSLANDVALVVDFVGFKGELDRLTDI